MAKKRKTVSKSKKKVVKKKPGRGKKVAGKSARNSKPRRGSRRTIETSSGSASSSLDPKREGRLQLRDPGDRLRREQIGDLQGISMADRADSESVGELLDEGQTLEAEAVQAIEDAPDADKAEVRTREVPEDDVPEEYRERD
jgi:hypothetical protein